MEYDFKYILKVWLHGYIRCLYDNHTIKLKELKILSDFIDK